MKKTNNREWDYDCAIIGGGPGGLVTALYLCRFRRRIILFNSGKPRASWGPKVNNLIGYYHGITGNLLLRRLKTQIKQVGGLDWREAEAQVRRVSNGFEISTEAGITVTAKKVVLATGIEDAHPEVDNLTQLRDLGLLKYCSICDGFEIRNKPVAVLAKDDFGIQKALFIGNWTKKILIVIPTTMKLAPIRIKEIQALGARIVRCKSFKIVPAEPEGEGVWIHIERRKPILSSVIYVELGCKVKDSAFQSLKKLRRTKSGFLIVTTEQRTSIPGLFAVGDCVNLLGQISVASGQAAVAATTIHNDLLQMKKNKTA